METNEEVINSIVEQIKKKYPEVENYNYELEFIPPGTSLKCKKCNCEIDWGRNEWYHKSSNSVTIACEGAEEISRKCGDDE